MSAHIELLQATRAEIVNLLKRQGTMSVETLATELEISKVAVRRHLDQLEDQGFIGHSSERCERGRPKFIYSLTTEGDGLFPDRSADFACDLLSQIGQRYGAGAIDALLMDQADANIEALKREVVGQDFDARVRAVATQFNDRGYVAEIERLDDGSYRIVEHNCPIRDVADLYPQVCREELRVYSEVTGGTVVKTCCMIANEARSCEYRIMPNASITDAPANEFGRRIHGDSPSRNLPIVSASSGLEEQIGDTRSFSSSSAAAEASSQDQARHKMNSRTPIGDVTGSESKVGTGKTTDSISISSEHDSPSTLRSKTVSGTGSEGDSSFRGASRKVCMSVCVNVHCSMNGADELVEHLVSHYGVAPDVPSETGLSVELTYCFGACDLGPNVEIDGQFSDGVTVEILDGLLAGLNTRPGQV